MNHQPYNGYYNYETWNFSLHCNNDEYLNDLFSNCRSEEDLEGIFDLMVESENEYNLFVQDVIQSFKSEINFRELIKLIEYDRPDEDEDED